MLYQRKVPLGWQASFLALVCLFCFLVDQGENVPISHEKCQFYVKRGTNSVALRIFDTEVGKLENKNKKRKKLSDM